MGLSANDLRAMHTGGDAPAEVPAPAPVVTAQSSGRGVTFKPNAYAGDCIECGGRVEAQAGLRDRRDGRWVVWHRGGCPAKAEAAPEETAVPRHDVPSHDPPVPAMPREATVLPIHPGTYSVVTEDGHRTFKVIAQSADADFAPGEIIIAFLSGSDNVSDFTSFGFVKAGPRVVVWKRFRGNEALDRDVTQFLADPDAALVAKNCLICNRVLTTPESISVGIGPVCLKG